MLRSAERRRTDVSATKQTGPETTGGGDEGERQGEEEEKVMKEREKVMKERDKVRMRCRRAKEVTVCLLPGSGGACRAAEGGAAAPAGEGRVQGAGAAADGEVRQAGAAPGEVTGGGAAPEDTPPQTHLQDPAGEHSDVTVMSQQCHSS